MTPEHARTIATERLKRLHDPVLRQQADAAREAMQDLGARRELGWLALGHANEALQNGDSGLADRELEAAFTLVEPELDMELWLGLLTVRGMLCAIESDTAGQVEAYTALLDAADRSEHVEYQVAARGSLALSAIRCGIDADGLLVDALALVPSVEDPIRHEVMLRTTRLYNAIERDVCADVRADELLGFLQHHPQVPDRARALAHVWVAAWLVDDGRPHPALELSTPLLRRDSLRMGQEPALVRWVCARAHLALGELDRARGLAQEGLQDCPSGRYYTVERRLHELLSQIAEADGDFAVALRHQRRASTISLAHEHHHLASAVNRLMAILGRDAHHHRHVELAVRNQSLASANQALEREVQEHRRTSAELNHTQKLLVRSAHAAGMSQVASDVLHNIGNALNGLGVSAQLVYQQLREGSSTVAFGRLNEHLADEGVTRDTLAEYVRRLHEHAVQRHERLVGDVRGLLGTVEHISSIVASQQEIVRARGVEQTCDLRTVVAEARALSRLHPQASALRVCAIPDIVLHTDIQLLVGALDAVLRNGLDAVCDVDDADRWVELGVWQEEQDVVFSVTDGGPGVSDGLRDRLFQHGVSDKPGHDGFGLHHAALAARSLGGTVTLWPPDAERGACFILRVRCERSDTPVPLPSTNGADG